MAKAQNSASALIDVGAAVTPIDAYRFLGNGGAATLKGYYVDKYGYQTGVVFSLPIPQANGSNDPVGFETALAMPPSAVGVLGVLSANVYQATCGGLTTETADFKANYVNYPQAVSITPLANGFGRLA